jgi:hypothetical protein
MCRWQGIFEAQRAGYARNLRTKRDRIHPTVQRSARLIPAVRIV